MKTIAVVLSITFLLSAGTPALAQDAKAAGKGDGKTISDFMASFWSKVVKTGKKKSVVVPTSVAGLRGEEQKKEDMTPYWKGKGNGKDGAAMTEIEGLVNKKEYGKAIDALKAFGPSYPDSTLKPSAVLMLAYCYTQSGKNDDARQTFEGFIKDYPNHELAADAKAGLEMLKSEKK